MTEQPNHDREESTESLLDDLLDGRAPVGSARSAAERLDGELELQQRIDSRLTALFQTETPTAGEIEALLQRSTASGSVKSGPSFWWAVAALSAAASVAWFAFFRGAGRGDVSAPHFTARPLVEVYRQVVGDGFEPYYECREADRFADTFARRQGQPLALLPLPAGVSMLGLSYPGGLSRDTTAMLCHVDGQPVMVFVDRVSADKAAATNGADATTHVFRNEREGLVFYEVTPFESPRVMEFMAPAADASNDGERDESAARGA